MKNKQLISNFKSMTVTIVAAILLAGCTENVQSKLYGGNTKIKKPEAHWKLLNLTWKDASLWTLWYDPKTNQCHFKEDSPFGILQGSVTVENCDPLHNASLHVPETTLKK